MSSLQDELHTWAQDEKIILVPQDEELLLSGFDAALLLAVLDSDKALPSKQTILLEALFVRVYDGDDEELILKELKQRLELVQHFSVMIPDYLKTVVFPKLGLHR